MEVAEGADMPASQEDLIPPTAARTVPALARLRDHDPGLGRRPIRGRTQEPLVRLLRIPVLVPRVVAHHLG